MSSMHGVKFDQEKRRASLVPWEIYDENCVDGDLLDALRAWQIDDDRDAEYRAYERYLATAPLDDAIEVMEFGANKYTANGWRTVDNAIERYRDALWRHVRLEALDEHVDPDSGLEHRKHVNCNVLFLYILLGDEEQDEPAYTGERRPTVPVEQDEPYQGPFDIEGSDDLVEAPTPVHPDTHGSEPTVRDFARMAERAGLTLAIDLEPK